MCVHLMRIAVLRKESGYVKALTSIASTVLVVLVVFAVIAVCLPPHLVAVECQGPSPFQCMPCAHEVTQSWKLTLTDINLQMTARIELSRRLNW